MYRPKDWAKTKRKYCAERLRKVGGADCKTCPAEPQTCNVDYEAGADAIYKALWKMAEESPTKTFTLDTNVINV